MFKLFGSLVQSGSLLCLFLWLFDRSSECLLFTFLTSDYPMLTPSVAVRTCLVTVARHLCLLIEQCFLLLHLPKSLEVQLGVSCKHHRPECTKVLNSHYMLFDNLVAFIESLFRFLKIFRVKTEVKDEFGKLHFNHCFKCLNKIC